MGVKIKLRLNDEILFLIFQDKIFRSWFTTQRLRGIIVELSKRTTSVSPQSQMGSTGLFKFQNHVEINEYLLILRFHYTPAPGDHRNKPAKMAALSLHEWMVKHGVDQTVLVLGGDSTNENTGWQGSIKIQTNNLSQI